MNIDFSNHLGFSLYVILLAVSGFLMVGIGATSLSRLGIGWRIFNVIAGLAFFGYAFYLAFLFHGGTYIIFFKAFILPAFMVINAMRSAATRRKATAAQHNAWAASQQQGWPAAPYGSAGPTPQPAPYQAAGGAPQQNGWPAPQQQGWPANPQPAPYQPGGPVPPQSGWTAPQQPGQYGPQ